MPLEEIGEIKSAVSAFKNSTNFLAQKQRWQGDFDLWRMKPYDAGTGYFSYTTNAPKNLAKKAISMITEAKLQIRIPDEILKKEELEVASNVERFMHGILTLVDEDFTRIPDMPSLRGQMAWHILIRGSFAIRPYIYKDKEDGGKTKISIAIWDMYNTAYGKGASGVTWAAHLRKATKEEVKDEFDLTVGEDVVDVIDYWDKENNGIIVGNDWGKKLEPHGLDYVPVFIIRSGDQPQIFQENYNDTNIHQGESIYDSNRLIYPSINKTMSDWQTLVRRGVKPPIGYWSAGAEKTLEKDIYQVEKAAVIELDSTTGEKLEAILTPTMPADAMNLLTIMTSEEQLGGISHVAQGELGFRLSGFAINQLQASLSTVIIPFVSALDRAYSVSLLSLLQQYSVGGWEPIEVRGRTSKNQSFGVPKAVKLSPKDIEGNWHPEISLIPVLPKDDAQRFELARVAKQSGLLSLDTIQGDTLGIDDPRLEQEKQSREWSRNLPAIKLLDAFEAALAYGDIPAAMSIAAELKKYMAMTGGKAPAQANPEQNQIEKMAESMPGTGLPGGPTGLSSEVMPAEMNGGVPPGAASANGNTEGVV